MSVSVFSTSAVNKMRLWCCSVTNGSQSNTVDDYYEKPDAGEEFSDDFPSETDEDEYCVYWKGEEAIADGVDSHHCSGLFAIAEERSPDVVREQSWSEAERDRQLMAETAETDEVEEQEVLEWTEVETRQEGQTSLANEAVCHDVLEISDRSEFDGKISAMFNCAESGSFGLDGLSVDTEQVVGAGEMNEEYVEHYSTLDQTRENLTDESRLEDFTEMTSNWQVDCQVGSGHEETFHHQTDEEIEKTAELENELMCETVAGELEDDISERCGWHSGNHDFISSQADTWLRQDQDFDLHKSLVKEPLKVNVSESEENSDYTQGATVDDSRYRDHDPHADGYWKEDCQTSALPTSVVDVVHVQGHGHQMMFDDRNQQRVVGRRWGNAPGSGTVDASQGFGGSAARDQESDQSAAEQDTLPRRGHMKTLLAQWRELEQRRMDEQLIERAAAINSDRSRRTAVRAAWFKAPIAEQQKGLAGTRSQSCGPVSRKPTNVDGFDGSSSRRTGSVGDDEESEVTYDRLAIKEKFEQLDAEAQRTTIFNRKKVDTELHFHFLNFN